MIYLKEVTKKLNKYIKNKNKKKYNDISKNQFNINFIYNSTILIQLFGI